MAKYRVLEIKVGIRPRVFKVQRKSFLIWRTMQKVNADATPIRLEDHKFASLGDAIKFVEAYKVSLHKKVTLHNLED